VVVKGFNKRNAIGATLVAVVAVGAFAAWRLVATPEPHIEISSQSRKGLPRYVPTSSRANIVTVLLIVGAVLSLVSSIISLSELIFPGALFGDEESTDPLTLAIALLVLGIGLLTAIVYIATVVLFLMWLYRAHENLQAFGVRKNQLEYSSGWAVGSFFVPFVSLVVPYRAIRELWRKSVPESSNMFGSIFNSLRTPARRAQVAGASLPAWHCEAHPARLPRRARGTGHGRTATGRPGMSPAEEPRRRLP